MSRGGSHDVEAPTRLVYRTDEVAAMLGISQQHARKLFRDGKLAGVRIGGTWYANKEYFDRLVRGGLDYGRQTASALLPAALALYELAQRAWPWLDALLPG